MTEGLQSTEPVALYGSNLSPQARREAFRSGQVPVAVYGLGKMGLPLAVVYAETCGNVVGVDIDPEVVETVNDGDCHVKREPGLADLVAEQRADGRLTATADPVEAAEAATVHVVIVPTPITDDKEPDLSKLEAAVRAIGEGLDAGDTVVVECTVPPRTTEGLVQETLAERSGLDPEVFGVAMCPERTSSGRALEDIRGAYPKVVGGVDEESTRVVEAVYEELNSKGVIRTSGATTAEAVKVFEGLYRDVNIALANELATLTDEMGIDVNEAIEVANTQPFCDIHNPGPGVGGHCIPFYPYFVIDPFETETRLLETAREVNDAMPEFTVEKLREGLEGPLDGMSVVVFGLTYRAGVEELRASPGVDIVRRLITRGAQVSAVDPMVGDADIDLDVEMWDSEDAYDRDVDGIVIATGHEDFRAVEWPRVGDGIVCVDGRGFLESAPEGYRVYTIGESSWIGEGGVEDE
jgi:UDP-N-acetyl-D-mannosaminuronic acid dehydrogenase